MSEVQTYSRYNLPAGYEDNRVVLMARDPHLLYAYWEVSNGRKRSFIEQFGPQLWEKSIPVLKLTNVTKNSSDFIRINDDAHNWYIPVPDANSLYVAELGRRISEEFFINLANSNYTFIPNDNVSSNTSSYFINYKDLRSGSLDMESRSIYESYHYKLHAKGAIGLSSPELFGINMEESFIGISSAELFGVDIGQHLGISSQSFINPDFSY